MSAAGPSQGANYAPSGGSAAAQAASVGVHSDAVVAVIGAGAMGTGIAQVAAQAGHPVRLFDARMGAAEAGGRPPRAAPETPAKKGKPPIEGARGAGQRGAGREAPAACVSAPALVQANVGGTVDTR